MKGVSLTLLASNDGPPLSCMISSHMNAMSIALDLNVSRQLNLKQGDDPDLTLMQDR